jgi:hypothetical protein
MMSEEFGDTGTGSMGDSQTSSYDGEELAAAGDTGEPTPEYGSEGSPEAVPYERFKESRNQLSDVRSENERLRQQFDELQEHSRRQAEYNQYYYQQEQQRQQPEAEEEYIDPVEKKVADLERSQRAMEERLASRQTELVVAQEQRELKMELDSAKARYPSMNKMDVVNAVIRSPRASVAVLAKRSHEKAERAYNERLRREGYSPKPKTLTRGQGPMPVAKDFGDDMDGAEAAAVAFLDS